MKKFFFLLGVIGIFTFPNFVSAVTCRFGTEIGSTGQCRGYITSTTTTSFTVPSDWSNASNTIEVIGAGGMGGDGDGASGGGGGGYSKVSNQTLSGTVTYQVGWGGQNDVGADSAGGDTWFCNSSLNCASIGGSAVIVGAKGGGAGETGGDNSGGSSASGVGTTKYSGGNGGPGQYFTRGGGGGGGAGGPHGNGASGGDGSTSSAAGGGGGGGANGGSAGASAGSGIHGANGGNNRNGTGAGAGGVGFGAPGSAGTDGGGGGGGGYAASGGYPGSTDPVWDATHGPGSGAGGASGQFGRAERGADYGGGGGGDGIGGVSKKGGDGIIVITYQPAGRRSLAKPPNNLGLVGYWSFNEGTSTSAGDFSGKGYLGTLSGGPLPSWINGKSGKALSFSGGSYVAVPTADADFTGPITIMMWVNLNSGTNISFASKNASAGASQNPFDFRTTPSDSRLALVRAGSGYEEFTGNNPVPLNGWHHIAVTSTSGNMQNTPTFYIDGIAETGNSGGVGGTGAVSGSGHDIWIGRRDDGAVQMDGKIDEVRIYNRALSTSEISNSYKQGAVVFGGSEKNKVTNGLIGYWPFNGNDVNWTSGTAGVAYDRSGLGNNGTLTGMNQATSTVTGKMGQAISLDSSGTNYVDLGTGLDSVVGSRITVSAWVYRRANSGEYSEIVADELYGSNQGYYLGDTMGGGGNDSVYGFRINGGAGSGAEAQESSMTFNEWVHYVGVFDADFTYLYKNGVLVDSKNHPDGTVNLDSGSTAVGRQVNGSIDDVRIYNRALSATEVKQLYNLGGGMKIKQ